MAKYTPKNARERGDRFETSWQANSPDKEWADLTLANFKIRRKEIADVEDELAAVESRGKALLIQRDNLNEKLMEDCDYVAAAVESDRNFGPDSALYGGFGYIRKSEKKKGGGKKKSG